LLADVEEQLAAVCVELSRNENRAAQREAEIVIALRFRLLGQASIRARVEGRILMRLKEDAMELARSAFCHHPDQAAGSSAKLGLIVRRQNLNFLDRVDILRTHRKTG